MIIYIWVVSKIGGKPKMDGENNGKPYFLMDDLGGKPTIFGNFHIQIWCFKWKSLEVFPPWISKCRVFTRIKFPGQWPELQAPTGWVNSSARSSWMSISQVPRPPKKPTRTTSSPSVNKRRGPRGGWRLSQKLLRMFQGLKQLEKKMYQQHGHVMMYSPVVWIS